MFFLPFFSVTTWTLIVLALTLLLLYGIWPFTFFTKMGVDGPRPFPFVGTMPYYIRSLNFSFECSKKYGDVWGQFEGRSPLLMVTDPDMLKVILVKECYSTFTNRSTFAKELFGPLKDGLTLVEDDRWKRIRSTISPSFTSGRLRQVFPIVERYADRLVKTLDTEKPDQSVDVKKFVSPYCLDVITSASFSIDSDTTVNPDGPLSVQLRNLLKMKIWPFFVIIALPIAQYFFRLIGFSIVNKASVDYFQNLLKSFKHDHKEDKSRHSDFLQLMIDSEINESDIKDGVEPSKGLTEPEILSQALIFIFGGYDITSATLSYILYNLALNPDAQQTLQQKIDVHFPKHSPVSYEDLVNLEYLDNVISESMRLLPTAPRIDRMCKKTIQINGLTIPEGTAVGVPLTNLHRDPRFWTSPELFKPERFSKDHGEDIHPYAYMPFGLGPRNCVGMRFAVMVMKMVLVRLLQDHYVETCKDTVVPLEFNMLFQPKEPIKLMLSRREL
ncbi:cytochrome P450 3A27 isoform X3 [Gadus morhua]|uniref:cytochrome P450 3A27 isoform X3 n=2 Tax=Gadus morhua TaxID=8049 RepID=UPI0011B55E01|nr:cytochrome P450 3A27-like isoform X3 [Gadus morhua]